MTLDPKDEALRQAMHRVTEKFGEHASYDSDEGTIVIHGVRPSELEYCKELLEEPNVELETKVDEDGNYTVTARVTDY